MAVKNTIEKPAAEKKSRQPKDSKKLTDVELITILLHHGHYGEPALDFAQKLLKGRGLLATRRKFSELEPDDTESDQPAEDSQNLLAPNEDSASEEAARPPLHLQYPGPNEEVFVGLFLDSQRKVVAFEKMWLLGQIDNLTTNPDDQFTYQMLGYLMQHQADGFVLAHYRPDENSRPMPIDVYLMQWLTYTLSSIGIRMLDYIVMSQSGHFSFEKKGLM